MEKNSHTNPVLIDFLLNPIALESLPCETATIDSVKCIEPGTVQYIVLAVDIYILGLYCWDTNSLSLIPRYVWAWEIIGRVHTGLIWVDLRDRVTQTNWSGEGHEPK